MLHSRLISPVVCKESPSKHKSLFEGDTLNNIPLIQATMFYKRAHALYVGGTGSSSELERVLRDLLRAITHMPGDVTYHIFLAKVYRRLHDYHSMMTCLQYALKLDPKNAVAKRMIFLGYMKRGQEYMNVAIRETVADHSQRMWLKAISCYEAACQFSNDSTRLWLHLAISYIYTKDYNKALTAATHCLRGNINGEYERNVDILTLRAKLFWALGYIEHGNKEIREVAKIAPDHVEVLAFTARCYHAAENYYKFAIKEFGKQNYFDALHYGKIALKITEDDLKLYVLISKINRTMGNLDEAYEFIRKAQDLYTDQVVNNISHLERQKERETKTLNAAKNKIQLAPESKLFTEKFQSVINSKFRLNNLKKESFDDEEDINSPHEPIYEEPHLQMEVPDEIIRQTNLIFNDLAISYAMEGEFDKAIVLFNKVIKSSIELCERFKAHNQGRTMQSTEESIQSAITNARKKSTPTAALKELFYQPKISTHNDETIHNISDTQNALYKTSHNSAINDEDYYKYMIDYRYYVNRGDCYRAIDNLSQAYQDYITGLSLSPSDWSIKTKLSIIHYLYSVKYFNTAEFQQADKEITKAINYNPKISEYYALRGKIRYIGSDYSGTAKDYKKCIELNPNAVDIAMKLEQFEAGGSHSMIQLEEKLPANILRLIKMSEKQMKKLKNQLKSIEFMENDNYQAINNILMNQNDIHEDNLDTFVNDNASSTNNLIPLPNSTRNQSPQIHRKLNKIKNINSKYDLKISQSASLPSIHLSNKETPDRRIKTMQHNENVISALAPHFVPVLKQSHEYKKSKQTVQNIIKDKLDTTKGQLWGLLSNAKEIANDERTGTVSANENNVKPSLPASKVAIATITKSKTNIKTKEESKQLAIGLSQNDHYQKKKKNLFLNKNKKSGKKNKLNRRSSTSSELSKTDTFTDADDDKINQEYDRRYQILTNTDGNNLENINEDMDSEYDEDMDSINDSDTHVSDVRQAPKSSVSSSNKNKKNCFSDSDSVNSNKEIDINLFKPKNFSRLAKLLETAGADNDWEINETADSASYNGMNAMLLSEEDEVRLAYQKAQILVEDRIIDRKLTQMKREQEDLNKLVMPSNPREYRDRDD